MELAEGTGFVPTADPRKPMPVPPPVKLVTVEDARLPASTGLERLLDAFYAGLLQFERDGGADGIVYRAENFRLIFEQVEGLVERDTMRMLGIEVRSLPDAQQKLRDAELPYAWERGLQPGQERIVLLDPAGNWVALSQARRIM